MQKINKIVSIWLGIVEMLQEYYKKTLEYKLLKRFFQVYLFSYRYTHLYPRNLPTDGVNPFGNPILGNIAD